MTLPPPGQALHSDFLPKVQDENVGKETLGRDTWPLQPQHRVKGTRCHAQNGASLCGLLPQTLEAQLNDKSENLQSKNMLQET